MTASGDFVARVYDVVARVPNGRVTTYGLIAKSLGSVRGARMVGWALHGVPGELDLPCHRVVNRYGELSGGWHFGHPDVMKALLEAEDVPFKDEYQVDLDKCLWVPWEEEASAAAAADEMDDFDEVAGVEDR